jgi:hypothetical protein
MPFSSKALSYSGIVEMPIRQTRYRRLPHWIWAPAIREVACLNKKRLEGMGSSGFAIDALMSLDNGVVLLAGCTCETVSKRRNAGALGSVPPIHVPGPRRR